MAGKMIRSLMFKQTLSFLIVALVPIILIGFLSFFSAKSALEKAEYDTLHASKELCKRDVLRYLRETVAGLNFLANIPSIQTGFTGLEAFETRTAGTKSRDQDEASIAHDRITYQLAQLLSRWQELYESSKGYDDLLMIDREGRVIYAHKKRSDFRKNLAEGELKNSGLARLWQRVMETEAPCIEDFSFYQPAGGPTAFVGVPLLDANGMVAGLLALALSSEQINSVFSWSKGTKGSGEVYLVGEDFLRRSDTLSGEASVILKQKVDTASIRNSINNQSGTALIKDAEGRLLLSSYSDLKLNEDQMFDADFDWIIVSELLTSEAFKPVEKLSYYIAGAGVFIGILVCLAAFYLAGGMALPMRRLAQAATRVSQGDLHIDIPAPKRRDEIGSVVEAFRIMVDNLRQQILGITSTVDVVSSVASEITSSVSQVADSTSQTSSAVTETSTTIQQLKQSANMVRQKSRDLDRVASQAAETCKNGENAVQLTAEKINEISNQIQSSSQAVVKLKDHSLAIEKIILTVQDIADQSNLLAVNASIEAAKAGDHGKGFTVVAQEIKNLSTQSKEATHQIRAILVETKKRVDEVVSATESGILAVEEGVDQSIEAGQAIATLSESVSESAASATMIQASGDQQFTGMDMVTEAMSDIEEAIRKNVTGTQQLSAAAKKLADLDVQLKDLVAKYNM